MSNPAFDAAGFLHFDLENGTIRSPGDEQLALLPVELISNLAPNDKLPGASRKWGELHGKRLADHLNLKDSKETAGIDVLASYLSGSLAVAGLGQVSLEIRSDALLFCVAKSKDSALSPCLKTLLCGFFAGYISVLIPAYSFDVIFLAEQNNGSLFFAGNPQATQKVQLWLQDGKNISEALELLAAIKQEEGK